MAVLALPYQRASACPVDLGQVVAPMLVDIELSGLALVAGIQELFSSPFAPIRVTWWLILIHLVEISVWGLFYFWKGCLPDAESAFYFSAVTYTTIGYGDLVLSEPWRMLGPIEGLIGILMCGLSTAIFFAMISRILLPRSAAK